MKIQEAMTRGATHCIPGANLAQAVALMWENDCGLLPVVEGDGKLVGVITDRDISMAVGTRHLLACQITVREVISGQVYSCAPEDDIETALQTMVERRVRRLPVTDSTGMLLGVFSITDAVHLSRRTGVPSCETVLRALAAICEPWKLPAGTALGTAQTKKPRKAAAAARASK